MFIEPRRNPSILEWSLRSKPIEHDPIAISAFEKLDCNPTRIGEFVHVNLYGAFHLIQALPRVIEVIPGRGVSHAADQCGAFTFEVKLAAIIRMFRGLEDS